jgi:hypothetical protein
MVVGGGGFGEMESMFIGLEVVDTRSSTRGTNNLDSEWST